MRTDSRDRVAMGPRGAPFWVTLPGLSGEMDAMLHGQLTLDQTLTLTPTLTLGLTLALTLTLTLTLTPTLILTPT